MDRCLINQSNGELEYLNGLLSGHMLESISVAQTPGPEKLILKFTSGMEVELEYEGNAECSRITFEYQIG